MPRAAVCHTVGRPLVVEQVELAPPRPDEVRVGVRACAVCHSDVAYLGGAWPTTTPMVLGHEAAGVVLEADAEATAVEPGDHVVVSLVRHCGRCANCRGGRPSLCRASFALDRESPIRLRDGRAVTQGLRCGAFADEVVVHASQVVAVPRDLPFTTACLLGCAVITGFGAVEHEARVAAGDRVAVIGAGGVGLNVVQAAAVAGAGAVVAIDVSPDRLEAARAFGATSAVDRRSSSHEEEIRAALGDGADHVFVAVGLTEAVEHGLELLAPGGTLVVVGMPPAGATARVDPGTLAHRGQRIVGSKMGGGRPADDVARLVGLYRERRIKLDELVSATHPLAEIDGAVAASAGASGLRHVVVP